MPSHFHSPKKSFGSSAARSLSSIAWASIAGRKGTASRLAGLWPRPSSQANSSTEVGPNQLNLLRVFVAQRSGRGLRKPRRDADSQAAGHELEQRPAPGLVKSIEPTRKLPWQLRFAERGERSDDRRQQQLIMALRNVTMIHLESSRASGGGSIPGLQ